VGGWEALKDEPRNPVDILEFACLMAKERHGLLKCLRCAANVSPLIRCALLSECNVELQPRV